MSKYFFILIFICSNTFANNINWTHPKEYLQSDIKNCKATIIDFVSKEKIKNKAALDKDLTLTTLEIQSLELDVNLDGAEDYFILLSSAATCGTDGCSTMLFVSSEIGCKQVHSPHLHISKEIGISANRIYFNSYRLNVKNKCGVWEFKSGKLEHIENIPTCD